VCVGVYKYDLVEALSHTLVLEGKLGKETLGSC
jgi:hypothetical protein